MLIYCFYSFKILVERPQSRESAKCYLSFNCKNPLQTYKRTYISYCSLAYTCTDTRHRSQLFSWACLQRCSVALTENIDLNIFFVRLDCNLHERSIWHSSMCILKLSVSTPLACYIHLLKVIPFLNYFQRVWLKGIKIKKWPCKLMKVYYWNKLYLISILPFLLSFSYDMPYSTGNMCISYNHTIIIVRTCVYACVCF